MICFLDLPFEIRDQIYCHLLILPDIYHNNDNNNKNNDGPLLHPAILSTCHQIHYEALPILYTKNTFQCHPTLLTSFPRLHLLPPTTTFSSSLRTALRSPNTNTKTESKSKSRRPPSPPPQLTETSCPGVALIRQWYLHARLDCGPFWTAETVRQALTGAEALELEVSQSQFRASGPEVLRLFEGVRGLRRVRVWGSTTGLEGYVAWLEGVMRLPVGSEVAPYVERVGEREG